MKILNYSIDEELETAHVLTDEGMYFIFPFLIKGQYRFTSSENYYKFYRDSSKMIKVEAENITEAFKTVEKWCQK